MNVNRVLLLAMLLAMFTACGGGEEKARDTADTTNEDTPEAVAADLGSDEPIDVGVPVKAGSDIDLRYRFRKGETFGYRLKTVENVVQTQEREDTIMSREDNNQVTIYEYRFKVLEVRAQGGATLRATCLRVQFDGTYVNPGGTNTIHYDSGEANDEGKERQFARYNAPVNTPFTITIDATGRLGQVSDLEAVIRRYMLDDYNRTQKESRDLVTRDYAEMQLKQVLQLAFQKVPDHLVGIDSTWSISQPSNIGFMSVRNDATYVLAKMTEKNGEKLAQVKASMVSTYTGDRKVDTGQGMATMDAFDVDARGTSLLNVDLGRPMRRFLRSDVHVRMFIEPPDELKQLAPEQAQDFWWTQKAYVENTVSELEV